MKYYGWEKFGLNKVKDLREIESKHLKNYYDLRGNFDVVSSLIPYLISTIVFTAYILING